MCWESSDVVRFDLGLLLQGQMRVAKLKSTYNSFNIAPTFLGCETILLEIVGWESSGVVRCSLVLLL